MKDSIKKMPKVLLVTSFFILFSGLFSTKVQAQMTDEEYAVINSSFFHDNIYHTTLFDKGWAYYFEDIETILNSQTGFPTWITDKKLRKKLDEEILNDIYSEIMRLKPIEMNPKKLRPGIHLIRHFDTKKALKKTVGRISKPIIVDRKIAVVKRDGIHISSIHILEKQKGKWKIIYTFYDWYIIID